ncbi:ABC transporter substrate-binding protein [Tropicibacter naphthalenivorans]|uniref:Maltose-binding periplasmic proteins/domains n=1 Tax=Tropicibacter naphthalenivorans TaxID=441103 RepID=A0A0P1H304_9RHOB|nr:extracellular solute-binding protein [Tropicibacter naphthalenivorans]CUH81984.1 Maltose-binding periplasmic proteins/domains [Tropicibacter naphthalenivorans]SMD07817.1 carbohydrate ABC transporter substrate-binding protein, CUT1 family [Tropicibacter naphthalenivorans]
MKVLTTTALGLVLAAGMAQAGCGIEGGSVRILANDFDALGLVISEAEACAGDGVTVEKNMTTEHKALQVPALTVDPAQYTVAVVANNSIVPLLNDDLVRPLDDLVEKYGQSLQPSQLIKIDGQTMAIAFMGNGQHLFLREDVLEEAGLEQPTTLEGILEAAQVIRDKGIMEYPLAGANQAGWYLGNEFVNTYLGYGGSFFEPGSAEPAISGEAGLKTLAMMKAMYLAGDIAIINQWGSMVNGHVDPDGPAPQIGEATVLAAAPTVGGGDTPAAALWWDGFTIAKNISDEDAEASFIAMVHGIRPEVAQQNPSAATWLMKDFTAPDTAKGVLGNAKAGAKPYPMSPYMGLMHTALGAELADFMQGKESAEQALADVSAAYRTAAQEAGFLN